MHLLFWLSFGSILYAYVGYAFLLRLFAIRKPVHKSAHTPTVSIVIAAHNEQGTLPAKLQNLRELEYPRAKLQVVIASDGSIDRTEEILCASAHEVVPVLLQRSAGKASALNHAVNQATGEILVFLDVRQTVAKDALLQLTKSFADPNVGAVSGELLLEDANGKAGNALGMYWKLEKLLRRLESESGSVVGATGAIYAIRRELYQDLPAGTILDDVFVPMNVVRQGRRVLFEPAAIARDRIFADEKKEFRRKVRTLTGNYQLLKLQPWLLSFRNPVLFRFVSHKLMRLAVPLLLVLLLITSALAGGAFYHAVFWMQIALYVLAALGAAWPSLRRFKPISVANTFTMLNAAATLALLNVVTGRKVVWT